MVTCAVRLPEGSRYCRLSACAYGLQRAIPSARGSVTSRSQRYLYSRRRNLNRLVIRSPLRVPLSPRLTLIRLTLLNFSRKYGYLLCRLVRRLAVLSGFSHPTPFNALFRQCAAVSLLGHSSTRKTGSGILTALASRYPVGLRLAPGSP